MGIRFYCPNGHKMHVKDFQAGQKGICPVCGVKMQIPLQSTRSSSRKDDAQRPPESGRSAAPPALPPLPVGTPSAASSNSLESPQPPADDPLADPSGAVWYVRPPSGGQYGPADGDLMRGWLSEGRIGADSLIWREGWRDWRPAKEVFREFSPPLVIPDLPGTAPTTEASRLLLRRSRAKKNRSIVLGSLACAAVFLFCILLWVLMKQ